MLQRSYLTLSCNPTLLHAVEVVFNACGKREKELTAAARDMVDCFQLLLTSSLQPLPGEKKLKELKDS